MGVLSTSPRLGEPLSDSVDGVASESGPGGEKASWITASPAFTAPWLGSCVSMIRQITPAAKSEIAIGMKTAVLNATDQRTRSVRTAKISPIEVTSAGTTANQIALLISARLKTV